jgi:hypothetical protein
MIERSPLQTDTSLFRIRDERRARFLAVRTEHIEHDVERQLLTLDSEIVGTTPEELRELRGDAPVRRYVRRPYP